MNWLDPFGFVQALADALPEPEVDHTYDHTPAQTDLLAQKLPYHTKVQIAMAMQEGEGEGEAAARKASSGGRKK